MQFLPLSFDTANYEQNYTDYSSQDSSMSSFSNELDNAISSGMSVEKSSVSSFSQEENMENDEENSSVYSTRTEIYSFFVPQDPRFNQEELAKLAKAFQEDNISIDAQNALADLMNKPEGPTLKELLSALAQSTRGGNASLSDTEIAYLQNLAGRANPAQPDLLYDSIRYSDGLSGMQNLMASLKQNPTTLSKQELSALSKAFNLPEDVEKGMQNTLALVKAQNGNKALASEQVDAVFKEAKAYLQSRNDEFTAMKNSLEKNIKSMLETAQKREAEERRALMRENRDVLYSKALIEDSVMTRVMGEDLNRVTHRNDLQNMEEKGVISQKEMENKLTGEKLFARQTEENSLTAKVQFEREASVKSEEKFFSNTLEEKENADKALDRVHTFQNNGNENGQDGQAGQSGHENFSQKRESHEMSHDERVLASMAASQTMQSDFHIQSQSANFAGQAENIRSQVQDSVLTMMKNGARRLEVSLNPLEMGQMAVVLTVKNGEVSAVIQAEKAESASLINQQVEVIRQELENQGFKVQNIEVEVGLSDTNSQFSDNNYHWESMQQHNSEQSFRENLQNLNYLRALTRKNSSSDSISSSTLAHNMQNTGGIVAGKENNSLQGLHIVT